MNKEQEIIQAAARIFRDKGFEIARLQDIAEEVGIRRGSLYHYIKSKDELLYKVIVPAANAGLKDLVEIVENQDISIMEKVEMAICNLLRLYDEYYPHYFVFIGEKIKSKEYMDLLMQKYKEYRVLWKRLLDEGHREGAIDPRLDHDMIFFGILGMCNWMHTWYRKEGRLPMEIISRNFSTMVKKGIF